MAQSVNVFPDGALLWYGNAVETLTASTVQLINTGSFPRIIPTITQTASETVFTQVCSNSSTTNIGGALFDRKFDLTDISYIKFTLGSASTATDRTHVAVSLTGADGSGIKARNIGGGNIDVSELSGEYYIGFQCEAPTPVGTTIINRLARMWLE